MLNSYTKENLQRNKIKIFTELESDRLLLVFYFSEKAQINVTNLLVRFSKNPLLRFLLIIFCIVYCCERSKL